MSPPEQFSSALAAREKVAWLVRVNRRFGTEKRYRTQACLVKDFCGSAADAVTAGTISRWESGRLRLPYLAVRRYEDLLGLPANQLVAVIDTTLRYFEPARQGDLNLTRKRAGDEAAVHRRVQQLLDAACSTAIMRGSDWDELTWSLAASPFALPSAVWTLLAERLLTEMLIADGIRWHQRYEAFNRILAHPIGREAAIVACGQLGRDLTNQVPIETISALDFSSHPEANLVILDQLSRPVSPNAQLGALLACFRKLRFGHFSPGQQRGVTRILRELTEHGTTGAARTQAALLLALPDSLVPGAGADRWSGLFTHGGAERDVVVRRLVTTTMAVTPDLPETFHDPVLPRLVEEMLFAISWDVRLTATSLIGASPYRDGIARALFDELTTDLAVPGRLDWAHVVLSALRFVGGSRERVLFERMVLLGGAPAPLLVAAAYSLGHLADAVEPRVLWAAVQLHARRWRATPSTHSAEMLSGLIYSAGVSGQKRLLAGVSSMGGLPPPAQVAARWWLDLPSHVFASVRS